MGPPQDSEHSGSEPDVWSIVLLLAGVLALSCVVQCQYLIPRQDLEQLS